MSLWRAFIEGFKDGLTVRAGRRLTAVNGHAGGERSRIDRLCRELGWSVDEREGSVVHLHFNSPAGGIRKVRIHEDDEGLITFSAHSFAVIPAAKLPVDILGYLLCRNINGSGVGMWGMDVDSGNNVRFHVMYQVPGVGVDAPSLQGICESLVWEAVDLDGKMRQAGLL